MLPGHTVYIYWNYTTVINKRVQNSAVMDTTVINKRVQNSTVMDTTVINKRVQNSAVDACTLVHVCMYALQSNINILLYEHALTWPHCIHILVLYYCN